ncbi:MAG: hypothetical protein WCD20_05035 [Rhodomicrobium sp.]
MLEFLSVDKDTVQLASAALIFLLILAGVNFWVWKTFFTAGKVRYRAKLRLFLFGQIYWAGVWLVFAPAAVLTSYYVITAYGIHWTLNFILTFSIFIVLVWLILRVVWLIIIGLPWLTIGLILAGSLLLLK